jgi:hypothetical protein
MSFNQKITDNVVSGCYNGSLAFFDLKAGDASGKLKPVKTTVLD